MRKRIIAAIVLAFAVASAIPGMHDTPIARYLRGDCTLVVNAAWFWCEGDKPPPVWILPGKASGI